jgi:hypothetical protein
MPTAAGLASIDKIVRDATAPIVAQASEMVARIIADLAAQELERQLVKSARRIPARRSGRATRRRRNGEMTRWVADRRARRVPTFVIKATGLDTKKKIVAKFGENVAFEKRKPLPPVKAKAHANPVKPEPRVVKARPPIVRKAAGAR